MNIEEIQADKKRNDDFSKWREEQAEKMPELAKRVFALSDRFYMGCGFHWGLVKKLGYCIWKLNDYDDGTLYHGDDAVSNQIILEVQVEGLIKDIEKAEASADKIQKEGLESNQ